MFRQNIACHPQWALMHGATIKKTDTRHLKSIMIDAQLFLQPQLVWHCERSLSHSQRQTVGTDHKGWPVSAQSVWHFSPILSTTGMWRRILVKTLNTVKPFSFHSCTVHLDIIKVLLFHQFHQVSYCRLDIICNHISEQSTTTYFNRSFLMVMTVAKINKMLPGDGC